MREFLPVDDMLGDIADCAEKHPVTILKASPGAGKTTRVPPALAEKFSGRIIMVEPRRVAASGAAERISSEAGTRCGTYAGFAVRGEKRCSGNTRILCVTTGIYLNMLLHDPSLEGVSAVIFDEFHERSMQSDLGFTLTLESRKLLRDDLRIILMSATIDENRIIECVPEAQIIDVPGRQYLVEIEHNSDSVTPDTLFGVCFRNTVDVLSRTQGNILVFMPGVAEIEKLCSALEEISGTYGISVQPLHGRLDLEQQNSVLHPHETCRRVVVATNIAESSVTIPDITVVIDSGYEKRLIHDTASGFDRLEICRISLESAGQRAGRAGRTAPGFVKRLWSKSDENAFLPTTVPEISECDLSLLALTLAEWGCCEDELAWITAPDPVRLEQARKQLRFLGALDENNVITDKGRRMAELPVHPRISAMLDSCRSDARMAKLGCEAAAVIEEMSNVAGEPTVSGLIYMLRSGGRRYFRCSQLAKQLQRMMHVEDVPEIAPELCAPLVMRIFPDRIGGFNGRIYRFSGGGSGVMAQDIVDNASPFIVCAGMQGVYNNSNVIRRYEKISCSDIREEFSTLIKTSVTTKMDGDTGKISSAKEERLGELVLNSSPCSPEPEAAAKSVVAEALRRNIAIPDPQDKAAVQFYHRVVFASKQSQTEFPRWHDCECWKEFLMGNISYAGNIRSFADLKNADILTLMRNFLGYESCQLLDRLYPGYFTTPAGARHPIDYSGEVPVVRARCQEFFGVKEHPCVGRNRLPLKIDLLSPAMRSTQITSDLPGFWKNSWHLVRKEMKSRYPKHDWPEDPANATAHNKVRI